VQKALRMRSRQLGQISFVTQRITVSTPLSA
jgi:hypothetical protein